MPLISFEGLEPPALNPQRVQQGLSGVLAVGLAGNGFADQRSVVEAVRGILKGGAGIKEQLGRPTVATMTEDVFPGAVVRRAGTSAAAVP